MLEGMLQATQGCLKEEMRMDVCANNLANANVIGFKTNKISFQDLLTEAEGTTEETSDTESEEGTGSVGDIIRARPLSGRSSSIGINYRF